MISCENDLFRTRNHWPTTRLCTLASFINDCQIETAVSKHFWIEGRRCAEYIGSVERCCNELPFVSPRVVSQSSSFLTHILSRSWDRLCTGELGRLPHELIRFFEHAANYVLCGISFDNRIQGVSLQVFLNACRMANPDH